MPSFSSSASLRKSTTVEMRKETGEDLEAKQKAERDAAREQPPQEAVGGE
jgi:hypothetical protein